MKRRDFIKVAGALAGAGLLSPEASEAKGAQANIKKKNMLGRTGLEMSDISFGGGALKSPMLVAQAVKHGINYFDTAPDYGASETNLGKYLKKAKGRDKLIIASKFCDKEFYPGHLDEDEPVDRYIEVVEGSLKRLHTDYLDIVFVHAMGEYFSGYEERLFSENMFTAFERLKKAGKVRFLAVSSHGPKRMEELMLKAVKSERYDVIMPAFNFFKFPKVPEVIKEAHKRNIGVVAMKTLAGAKDINLDSGDEKFAHAAFKWTLKHKEVAGLIVTIRNLSELFNYIEASGQPYTKKSDKTLKRYRLAYTKEYCRTGCGECLDTCPHDLDIPGIFRQWMYFDDYGDEKRAMENYSQMKQANVCSGCSDKTCNNSCPHELPVSALLENAHEGLSFLPG